MRVVGANGGRIYFKYFCSFATSHMLVHPAGVAEVACIIAFKGFRPREGGHWGTFRGESTIGHAPLAVTERAAIGTHISVISGKRCQTGDGARIAGHIGNGVLSQVGFRIEVGASLVGDLPSGLPCFAVGPAQGGSATCGIHENGVRRLLARQFFLHLEVVEVESVVALVVALQDDTDGVGGKKELVAIPSRGRLGRHIKFTWRFIVLTGDKAQLCGILKSAVRAGKDVDAFFRLAGAARVAQGIKDEFVLMASGEGHHGKGQLQRSAVHTGRRHDELLSGVA